MTTVALEASWHTREPITEIHCVIFKPLTPNQQGPRSDNVESRSWGYGWLPHHHFSGAGDGEYSPLEMSDDYYEDIYKTTLQYMKEIIGTSLPDPWRVGWIEMKIIHSVRSEQDLENLDYIDTRKIGYRYSLCGTQYWFRALPTENTEWTFVIEKSPNAKPRPPLP